ncbi:MAG: RNA-binding S4 domain-containing protein [Proteobacteria bacterium]|nr:RNA-binding S4 domain-containing protein [Pseudomonadota bacterium]
MAETQRIDKWLWYARFYKSRSLCAKQVSEGKICVNDVKISKPAHGLAEGDVLTFVKAEQSRIIKLLDLGKRRGSASEAQLLFEDRSLPRPPRKIIPENPRFEGKGRPTAKDRRQTAAFDAKYLD